MTLEILSDFFLFISTNQKQINDNDLQSFEYFISKQFSIINSQNQHPVISKELNETSCSSNIIQNIYSFLTDFLFYLYNQQIIHIESNYLHLIDSKSINILKQKGLLSNGIDSYLEQQRRNIELQQIKTKETKRMLLKLLKENKLVFQIEPFHYISFLNTNDKYITVIMELMNKIKQWNDLYKEHNNNKNSLDDNTHKHIKSNMSYDKGYNVKDKQKFLEELDKIRDNINSVANEHNDKRESDNDIGNTNKNDIQMNENNNVSEHNDICNKTQIIQHSNINNTGNTGKINVNESININELKINQKDIVVNNNNNEVQYTSRNQNLVNIDNNVSQNSNDNNNITKKNTSNEIVNSSKNNNYTHNYTISDYSSKITNTENTIKHTQSNPKRKKDKDNHCCIIV